MLKQSVFEEAVDALGFELKNGKVDISKVGCEGLLGFTSRVLFTKDLTLTDFEREELIRIIAVLYADGKHHDRIQTLARKLIGMLCGKGFGSGFYLPEDLDNALYVVLCLLDDFPTDGVVRNYYCGLRLQFTGRILNKNKNLF